MDAERKIVFYKMALATVRAILANQDPLDVPKLIELIDRLAIAAEEPDDVGGGTGPAAAP